MRLDELERELRAERPDTDSEFARRLDEWAAAGFPRGEFDVSRDSHGKRAPRRRPADVDRSRTARRNRLAPLREPFARTLDRLRAVPPRRVLAPAGGVLTLVVVAAVVISQRDSLFGGGAESLGGGGDAVSSSQPARGDGAGAAEGPPVDERGGLQSAEPARADRQFDAGSTAPDDPVTSLPPIPPPNGGGGGIAAGIENRIVDATARVVLGAERGEVQEVANGVVEVTDRYDGITRSSQVTSDQGGARAAFELEIPAKRLDAALADLSELGDVVSRTEGGEDITARAVRARRALAETLQDIQQARAQLIRTDDPEQRRVIRSRIRFLDATADRQRAQLAGVHRQGRFATVSVEVTSDGPRAADDGWSLGDAADDALDVLTAVGGIILVSLAVLLPLAAIAAVAWLAVARARHASRERALDR
ncbi:MAG: DUF4349 domain-containing protein [Solirubrobacterales bacterium]